jgi:hypothetical protein
MIKLQQRADGLSGPVTQGMYIDQLNNCKLGKEDTTV